jgi:hypothetical protein
MATTPHFPPCNWCICRTSGSVMCSLRTATTRMCLIGARSFTPVRSVPSYHPHHFVLIFSFLVGLGVYTPCALGCLAFFLWRSDRQPIKARSKLMIILSIALGVSGIVPLGLIDGLVYTSVCWTSLLQSFICKSLRFSSVISPPALTLCVAVFPLWNLTYIVRLSQLAFGTCSATPLLLFTHEGSVSIHYSV